MSDQITWQSVDSYFKMSDTLPYCFYGKFSRMGMALSTNGGLQISLAPVLDGQQASGKVEKGINKFNNDAMVFFTLSPDETAYINQQIPSIAKGSYVNKDATDEKYKNVFSLTHYKDNNASRLLLTNDGPGQIKLTVTEPNKQSVSFIIKNSTYKGNPSYNLTLFVNLVKRHSENIMYDILKDKSNNKLVKQQLFNLFKNLNIRTDNSAFQNNSNNNRNNNYQNNQNNQHVKNTQPQPTQNDDPIPPPPPDEMDEFGVSQEDDEWLNDMF